MKGLSFLLEIFMGFVSFSGSCTFETSLCTYANARNDNFDWIRMKGSTPSFGTGPAVDHTTGRANGKSCFSLEIRMSSTITMFKRKLKEFLQN